MTSTQFLHIQSRTISILQNRIQASKNGWPRNMKRYWDNIEVLSKDRPNAIEQSLELLSSKDIAERHYAASLIGSFKFFDSSFKHNNFLV